MWGRAGWWLLLAAWQTSIRSTTLMSSLTRRHCSHNSGRQSTMLSSCLPLSRSVTALQLDSRIRHWLLVRFFSRSFKISLRYRSTWYGHTCAHNTHRDQFSSRWHLCTQKSPYTLHPVSWKFPQRCLWNDSNVRLSDNDPLLSFQWRSSSTSSSHALTHTESARCPPSPHWPTASFWGLPLNRTPSRKNCSSSPTTAVSQFHSRGTVEPLF